MRIAGDITLDAPRAVLWDALSDPAELGAALPGVDGVQVNERDGSVSARARPATGLGATPFDLRLWVREGREREQVTVGGEGRGGENAVTFTVTLDLRDSPAGAAVAWTARVVFLGVLGSVAQRVLPSLMTEQIEGVLQSAARPASGPRS